MELNHLYTMMRRAIAHVVVTEDGEKISEGSGFSFLPTGEILTAAHTIAGGFPVKEEELQAPGRCITVYFFEQNRVLTYKPAVCPIQINFTSPQIKPLQLDAAIIVPAEPQKSKFEYLKAYTHPPKLGDELYFGGYSNEIEFPFNFDRHIDSGTEGMDQFRSQFGSGIRSRISAPMIKHGIVGNIFVGSTGSSTADLNVTSFYLDNQIHSGASGGPVVSRNGDAVGMIIKRAVTSATQEDGRNVEVPSGSTLGIGLDFLRALQTR